MSFTWCAYQWSAIYKIFTFRIRECTTSANKISCVFPYRDFFVIFHVFPIFPVQWVPCIESVFLEIPSEISSIHLKMPLNPYIAIVVVSRIFLI